MHDRTRSLSANKLGIDDTGANKLRMVIEDDFSKNRGHFNAKVLSAASLKKEIEFLVEVSKRYAVELSYYQMAHQMTPEENVEMAHKIDEFVSQRKQTNLDDFLTCFDADAIDIFQPLLVEMDNRMTAAKSQIRAYESTTKLFGAKIRKLEEENRVLSEDLTRKFSELNDLYRRGAIDESSGKSLFETEIASIKNFVRILETENKTLYDGYEEAIKTNNQLKALLAKEQETVNLLRSGYDEIIVRAEENLKTRKSLEAKVDGLENELRGLRLMREAKITAEKMFESELKAKENEINALKIQLKCFEEKKDHNTFLSTQNSLTFEIEQTRLRSEVDDLKNQLSSAQKMRDELLAEKHLLKNELLETQAQLDTFKDKYTSLEKKMTTVEGMNRALIEDLNQYKHSASDFYQIKQQIENLKSRSRSEIEAVHAQSKKSYDSLVIKFKAKIEAFKAKYDRELKMASREVSSLAEQNQQLQYQLNQLKLKQLEGGNIDLTKIIDRNAEAREKLIDELNKEITRLNLAVFDLTNAKISGSNQTDLKLMEITYKQQIQHLESEIAMLKKRNAGLEKELQKLTEQMRTHGILISQRKV